MTSPRTLVKSLGTSQLAVYYGLCDHFGRQRRRQRHFHDGCYWVRMPYKDFPRMFQYLSADAVSRAIDKLEDKGLLRRVSCGSLSWYSIIRVHRRVV